MKDDDLLREHTDDAGNLHVDRLMGLHLKHVSVLPFGANRREVSAQREAKNVADKSTNRGWKIILRAGDAGRAVVNWITGDTPPEDVQKRGADAFVAAYAAELKRTGEGDPIQRLATDFGGVMRDEFLWDTLALFGTVWRETVFNIMITAGEDPRGEVEAAGAALLAHTLRLLDGAQEFTMTADLDVLRARSANNATTEETPMPMDAETRNALAELERTLRDELKKTTDKAAQVAEVSRMHSGIFAHVLREAGLEDNHLTALLQQFTITGSSPISSKVGDLAGMFGGALSNPMNAALTTMGTLFRGARSLVADENGAVALVTESELKKGLVATAQIVGGKVSEVLRGARRSPAGGKGPKSGSTLRGIDDVEGMDTVVSEIERRFGSAVQP